MPIAQLASDSELARSVGGGFTGVSAMLHLAERGYDAALLEAKERANYPHDMKFLNRDEIRSVVGSDSYIAGLVNMGNGHLHPINLCAGEAAAAVSLGATVFEQSPV